MIYCNTVLFLLLYWVTTNKEHLTKYKRRYLLGYLFFSSKVEKLKLFNGRLKKSILLENLKINVYPTVKKRSSINFCEVYKKFHIQKYSKLMDSDWRYVVCPSWLCEALESIEKSKQLLLITSTQI